jgi:hypothetical protein
MGSPGEEGDVRRVCIADGIAGDLAVAIRNPSNRGDRGLLYWTPQTEKRLATRRKGNGSFSRNETGTGGTSLAEMGCNVLRPYKEEA